MWLCGWSSVLPGSSDDVIYYYVDKYMCKQFVLPYNDTLPDLLFDVGI